MADEKNKVRTSKIVKSIERIYNIAAYESLRVSVSTEETIEWTSKVEREKQLANISKALLSDFNQTVNDVMKNQNVKAVRAFHKTPGNNEYKAYEGEQIGEMDALDSLMEEDD